MEVIWLTTDQLAARLGYSRDTIEYWRGVGKGPIFRKMPGRGERTQVRYKLTDVIAWEESLQIVDPAELQQKVQSAYEHISAQG